MSQRHDKGNKNGNSYAITNLDKICHKVSCTINIHLEMIHFETVAVI